MLWDTHSPLWLDRWSFSQISTVNFDCSCEKKQKKYKNNKLNMYCSCSWGWTVKTPAKTFTALNSTDTSTVYRHNKGNFSQLPVRDTLSTYPSAGLKTKALAASFHLVPATSSRSYLSHYAKTKFPLSIRREKLLHLHLRTQFVTEMRKSTLRTIFLSGST